MVARSVPYFGRNVFSWTKRGVTVARIDDYKESFCLACIELKKRDPEELAKAGGFDFSIGKAMTVPFLGTEYLVEIHPDTEIRSNDSGEEVPLPTKILIAHYLLGSSGKRCTGKLIAFRQIPDGHFYFEAFQKRARDPFVKFFGNDGPLFVKCAAKLGAKPAENGDFGMKFDVFPHICVQLVLWNADEEFPPDGTILFDESIQWHLPVEDVAVMSGNLVYKLVDLGRKMRSES
jgi:hypothetical protein